MTRKSTPPRFSNEAQERTFWESRDSSAFVDWQKAVKVRFPNLKPADPKRSAVSSKADGSDQPPRLVRLRLDPNRPPKGRTDWARVEALTDADVLKAAKADRDNPPLGRAKLAQAVRQRKRRMKRADRVTDSSER
ncbi:MAG: hypothetical protein IT565_11750 [Rhodospirillales bacterium]|nr:hypothetical protein [Rhodospirillales bacterium]